MQPKDSVNGLSISAPSGEKEALKANAYQFIRSANSQLAPLFPYCDEGAIVPTTVALRGGEGNDFGYFLHMNTVDEVFLCFGASGGRVRTGQVAVGAKLHGVAGPDGEKEEFSCAVITQRQLVGQPQPEAIMFQCEECQHELFKYEFEADAVNDKDSYFPPLDTIRGTEEAALLFNSKESNLKCPKCGHVNKPFPNPLWGWGDYMKRTDIVERGRRLLDEAAGA